MKYQPKNNRRDTSFFSTRVLIKNLFDYLDTGDSIETFLLDFESVSKNQVVKVLEMSQKQIFN
ncbi:MAG: DUF433 domain-containing protein [Sphingobacteriales bacterium]|nr:MAG: DUF433 domain-containing protein [Sphingobacteriales bacterium]